MSQKLDEKLESIPVIRVVIRLLKRVNIFNGLTLYDVIEMYFLGIVRGALTTRAGGIAYSFFMAIFPFSLFFLTLIPYIPIEGFQDGLFLIIQDFVPPKTFSAIDGVLHDILKNQYGGLLSFGFLASIFLMTNGVNSIFGNFEYSYHIKEYRNVFKTYFISLGVSLLMSVFLIITVVLIILYQIALVKIDEIVWIDLSGLNLFFYGRSLLILIMIFIVVSLLFRYGTKDQGDEVRFLSAGAILTTVLMMFLFYLFGIYILKFSKYNELYGSIGTLLIVMLYVWLNSIILLLGFELNATLTSLKKSNN